MPQFVRGKHSSSYKLGVGITTHTTYMDANGNRYSRRILILDIEFLCWWFGIVFRSKLDTKEGIYAA